MNELRKVQRTRGGTYFVSLPKNWARKSGLEKGVLLSVSEASDGKLVVDAKHGIERAPKATSLRIRPFLEREIIGKYLLGFDTIRVKGKDHVDFEARNSVKKTVSRLVGLEIVEEDYSGIVLQCLLEPSGFPPERILRRGHTIISGMHIDAATAFMEGNVQLAKSVMARDDEANRLYFLLVRILRTIVQNPRLSETLGVTTIDCLDYRLVANLVEAIGDECVRISMKTLELEGSVLSKELKTHFSVFHKIGLEAHRGAIAAFLNGNIALAEEVRGMRPEMERIFEEIEKSAQEYPPETVPHILSVVGFFRQIYDHSVDISDLAVSKNNSE